MQHEAKAVADVGGDVPGGRGRAAERSPRLREHEERGDECVYLPELHQLVVTVSPARGWPRASRYCVSHPRLASGES
jgi:hypothetical protein